jgi:hypothetical protein
MSIPLLIPEMVLGGYLSLFRLIDSRISRSREKRADMLAAITCGTECFSSGLQKVARLAPTFSQIVPGQIVGLLREKKCLSNCYAFLRGILPQLERKVQEQHRKALEEPADKFSSHPCLKERLAYVPTCPECFHNDQPAISLLSDATAKEEMLSNAFTRYLDVVSGVRQTMFRQRPSMRPAR